MRIELEQKRRSMKKVHLLTMLIALLAGFVVLPSASGHEGIGDGHYDYNGNGWGHIKHGDGGCTYCSAEKSEVTYESLVDGSALAFTEMDLLYETENGTDDILLLLEYWYYLELYREPSLKH